MRTIIRFLSYSVGVLLLLFPGLVRAQANDTTAVVNAMVKTFEADADAKSALLTTFVTDRGPTRRQDGSRVRLPTRSAKLSSVQPPENTAAETIKAWSKAARQYTKLYSIGEIAIDGNQAFVEYYVREPLSSAGFNEVGRTKFRSTLSKENGVWRVVESQPLLSTTFIEND